MRFPPDFSPGSYWMVWFDYILFGPAVFTLLGLWRDWPVIVITAAAVISAAPALYDFYRAWWFQRYGEGAA